MADYTKLNAVSSAAPCALCGGVDKCSRGADGLIMCGRRSGDIPGFRHLGQAEGDSQFGLYRLACDFPPRERNGHANKSGAHQQPKNWEAIAHQHSDQMTPPGRQELAEVLGLPESVLSELLIGFGQDDLGAYWTFPEQDASGRIIGISRRYGDGIKRAMPGSARGITIPQSFEHRSGPIFMVEGPSDTLALTAMGLCAIGRPSNVGGAGILAEFLKNFNADRPRIVVGEIDPNDDGKWPGKDGAIAVATKLAEKSGRPVSWALPPSGAKDVRAFALSLKLDPTSSDEWSDAGTTLSKHFEKVANTINPPTTQTGYRWDVIDSAEFDAKEYKTEWLVKHVFVNGQPAVVGGPAKALKTSLLVDLSISLASATQFLGKFFVPRRRRVAILSGESGGGTLQETARRICKARGITLAGLHDYLSWSFRLPQLSAADHLAIVQDGLRRGTTDVLIIDPLYLAMLAGPGGKGVQAQNLYEMGPLFLNIAQTCLEVGCTPILAHHTTRRSGGQNEIELTDLAFAGLAEFVRQWLLVWRRNPFDKESGIHELWMSVGGSAGQCGKWSFDIDEGHLDEQFGGRKWEVTPLATASEQRAVEMDAQKEKASDAKKAQHKSDDVEVCRVLDDLTKSKVDISINQIYSHAKISKGRAEQAIIRLVDDGVLERFKAKVEIGNKGKREADCVRRKPRAPAEG